MTKVVYFGERTGEVFKIRSSIEYAFDVYRKNLTSFMEEIGSIVERTIAIDKVDCRFVSIHKNYRMQLANIPNLFEKNEVLLRELTRFSLSFTYAIMPSCFHHKKSQENQILQNGDLVKSEKLASYDSMEQLVVHLNRDWGKGGESMRNKLYKKGILQSLQDYKHLLPISESMTPRVLVPGAGLGRLAVEISVAGFSVEMNECSGSMINSFHMLTSFFIPKLQCRCFYPHLTFALSDDWNFSERFCGATVPYYDDTPEIFDFFSSVNDSKNGNNTTSLSVQFGDFVKVYGSLDRSSSFDVVVTSFFIDTARDIYEYLAVIKNVLKPGGLWINSGPLHYHQRDAIPYSHEHLLSIFALFGFRVLNQQIITTSYCGDEFVKMKPEMYVIPLNVMQLEQLNSEVFEEIFENNEKPFASVNFITK